MKFKLKIISVITSPLLKSHRCHGSTKVEIKDNLLYGNSNEKEAMRKIVSNFILCGNEISDLSNAPYGDIWK